MRALELPWPIEELERRYRAARTPLAAKRYHALWLRKKGPGAAATADAVGITTETLRAWLKRGVAEGLDALDARKPGSGARPKLDAARRERVLAWADATPRVTMAALRRRVAEEWGIALSATQVWALARRRGFRRVVPRKRHYQADSARLAVAEKN